jgi:hypothetical protein
VERILYGEPLCALFPASLVIAPLGFTLGAPNVTAGAASPTAEVASTAPVTISGSVLKAKPSQNLFWFSAGAKNYRVTYRSSKTFSRGSAASLNKGFAVSVTGTFPGNSHTAIKASDIVL